MMPPKAFTTETHQRQHRVFLKHEHVKTVLALAASESVEHLCPSIDAPGTIIQIEFTQETQGSPPCSVGMMAIVTIIEDLLAQAKALADD